MAKQAYYFSHDSNAHEDEDITRMRAKHGWYGYGLYWAIIERLRDATDYKLKTDYKTLAFAMQTECERIKSVIEEFDLFVIEDGYFRSESLLRRMMLKEEKSQKARESANSRWKKNKSMRTHSDRNAIKGN